VRSFQSLIKKFLPLFAIAAVLCVAAPRLLAVEREHVAATQVGSEAKPEAHSSEGNKHEEDETDAFRHSAAVKAIGAKLGLDPEQAATAFTVANFVVLALLVGWFLLKTLPKTFHDRNSAIQKHLLEARAATDDASARLNSVEARLGKLDEQIASMRAQAEKDSAIDEQRIKASVEDEKQKLLSTAEQEIVAATAQARRQIQQYAADLAIEQAVKKLVVTAETDRLLVQDFARKLVGESAKEGHN
jgi:F-type H+-transporting ATPase subunit b